MQRTSGKAKIRGGVYDTSRFTVLHDSDDRSTAEKHRLEVGVQDLLPLVERQILNALFMESASREVYQSVNALVASQYFVKSFIDLSSAGKLRAVKFTCKARSGKLRRS